MRGNTPSGPIEVRADLVVGAEKDSGRPIHPHPSTNAKKEAAGLLSLSANQLWLNDVEEADADVRIPPHRKRSAYIFVFSSAAGNRAYREPDDGRESVCVLEWRLPLIGGGHADGNGSSI